MSHKRTLVTAALPYANGPVHIGHLAGCYLPADIFVRYQRMKGEDILFICGSDEHGVPITIKARNEHVSPQQIVDKYHALMSNAFNDFGISFDHYSRTTAPIHHQTAQEFFKNLYDKNIFIEETTEQYYDDEAKQFLADRYIEGTCPRCGNERAYGDQCENCGSSLNPTDLINPKSKLSGSTPVLRETKNWFLPMDAIQKSDEFQAYIKRFDGWKSNIKGQCSSWLTEGLQPRAMTRDLDWGVQVPLPDTKGKVLYVWFDAPIGYISATKEYFMLRGERRGARDANLSWESYWKDKDSRLIHFIGKDNIVFHAIIFPMMLMKHGGFILPENVPANEFLNLEGEKISTSRNWAVWLHEYLIDFPNRQDELRYVLTAIAPETKDSDFSWKDFQARVNNELVSILGNFVNRAIVLTHKFFDGKIPTANELTKQDLILFEEMNAKWKEIQNHIEQFHFRDAQFEFMNIVRAGNKYLTETEPWKIAKTDMARVATILNVCLQYNASLAIIASPLLPNFSKELKSLLNLSDDKFTFNNAGQIHLLEDGVTINQPKHLFSPIDDELIQRQIEKLHASKSTLDSTIEASSIPPALKTLPLEGLGEASFEDFQKMDLRVATILEAERVPKTDKLLKLKLDLGFESRTVVSGIAHCYEPEKIIGQQVVLLANLQPRKIKGIESKGMILMADDADGKLKFVAPSEKIMNGGKVS